MTTSVPTPVLDPTPRTGVGPPDRAVNGFLVAHLLIGALLVGAGWADAGALGRAVLVGGTAATALLVAWRETARQQERPASGLITVVALVVVWLPMAVASELMLYQQFTLVPAIYFMVDLRIGIGLVVVPVALTLADELSDTETSGIVIAVTVAGWLGGAAMARWIRQVYVRADRWHEMALTLEATRAELARVERAAGVDDERRRFAREIHDTIAQSLTGIVLQSERARRHVVDGSEAAAALGHIEDVARAALADARALVAGDHQPGSATAFAEDLEGVVSQPLFAALDVRVHRDGALDDLPPPVRAVALRVVREGLSNAVKHAQASRIDVSVSRIGGAVAIDVADDGRGLGSADVETVGGVAGGSGLESLRRQVSGLGGDLTLEDTGAPGAVLSVSIPVVGSAPAAVGDPAAVDSGPVDGLAR